MLAVSAMILSSPDQVCRVGNVFYPCVNMYKQFLSHTNLPHIQVQTLQTIGQIFLHPHKLVASAFIRNLAPDLLTALDVADRKADQPELSTVIDHPEKDLTMTTFKDDTNANAELKTIDQVSVLSIVSDNFPM